MATHYFILILILLGIPTIIVVYFQSIQLYEISQHKFIKFISRLTLFLFALIAFIFGIHSDIVSSYDKLNANIKHSYNWFYPQDIIKFPIDQFMINKEQFPPNEIDVASAFTNDHKIRKYSIVVDKTSSNKPSEVTKKTSKKLIESITTHLGGSVSQNPIDFSKISLEDLFLLNGLERLARDTSAITSFEIMYYFGDEIVRSPFDKDKIINSENLSETIGSCLAYIRDSVNPKAKKEGNVRNTDFKFIAKELKEERWCGNNKNSFSSVIIFSDFEHLESSGNSFESVNQSLQVLSKDCKITQVNLVKLRGRNKHPDWANQTLDLFREAFNHLYYYEFEEQLKDNSTAKDALSYSEQIASVFSSVNDDTSPQPVLLYYSWNNENYNFDYKGVMTLRNLQTNKQISFGYGNQVDVLRFNEKTSYLYFVCRKQKLFPYRQTKIEFLSLPYDTLQFVTNEKNSKNYFIEFSHPGSTQTIREPIILKQVLPTTSCLLLIYLYSFFGMAMILIIAYYAVFVLIYSNKNSERNYIKLSLGILSVAVFIYFMIVGVKVLPSYWKLVFSIFDEMEIIFFISIIMIAVLLYGSLFRDSYLEHKSDLKKV